LRVGIDIGGTFTDLIAFDERTGALSIGKVLTTPKVPAAGVEIGLAETLRNAGEGPGAIGGIIHGTTLVTNALIERKGATTALLTTKGFRDAVEIRREGRYDLYDLSLEMPSPLAPRRRRLEVDERILADGSILTPLDLAGVPALVARLRAVGAEAVAISLLHAYRNPEHERALGAAIAEAAPELVISLSSEVVAEMHEYERTSTTLANVYVRPIVERYLRELEERLRAGGMGASPLLVMLSSGGTATVETARRFPIRLIESGPAAGALAAAHYGALIGRPNLLSFDMGGTTAKACLIDGGEPIVAADFEVARVYRFKRGSGLPVRVPVIEMIEIGAGGGSIARVDSLGLLKVGPDSAGAEPARLLRSRRHLPTVTDADLLLATSTPLLPRRADGARRVAAAAAIAPLAVQLGLDPLAAAWGIHQVVNENMAGAARIHAVERGTDSRGRALFAFGGAGPVHAYRVAEILRAPELIVPLGAGVTSALGFLVAPLAFDFVRSYPAPLADLDWERADGLLMEMAAEGLATLARAGIPAATITVRRSAELRYRGQGHEWRCRCLMAPCPLIHSRRWKRRSPGSTAASTGVWPRGCRWRRSAGGSSSAARARRSICARPPGA
jgi:N-methylhydantoinase A